VIRERNGRYQVRVYAGTDPSSGKERHLYGTAANKRTARQLEAKFEQQAAKAKATSSAATLNDLLDRWLEVARHAPATRYTAEKRLAKHVRPALGGKRIARITTEHLDAFYLDLERQGSAPATVVRIHGLIRAAFAQAVRWGWLDTNPAAWATLPSVPNPEPRSPELEKVQQLLREADPDLAAFLRLVAATGMRRGEACALRRSDVDLDGGAIRKVRAISQGVERATKTGARYGIAVGLSTMNVLRDHFATQDAMAAEFNMALEPDCFVFSYEPDCSKPWRPDSVTKRFARLCDRLGIQGLSVKVLRDWMATSLLEGGASIRTVAGRAGHARASTTLHHYSAWLPASDAAAADQLDVLLDAP
jgi:integrase